jgi:hypothetical protein
MIRQTMSDDQPVEGWDEVLADAQEITTVIISGQELPRIPFGAEYGGLTANADACLDCGAHNGQLHVPACFVEQCPGCLSRVLGCECHDYDDDDDEVDDELDDEDDLADVRRT